MKSEAIPDEGTLYGWIETVFDRGVRRPGYAADRWASEFCAERFRTFGLERVRLEPVTVPYWEPRRWSLTLAADGAELPCFPLPHSAPAGGLEAELVPFDPAAPERVRGNVSLVEVHLTSSRRARLGRLHPERGPESAVDLAELATWTHDPDGSLAATDQLLPFGPDVHWVMEASMAAGAVGFVGVLANYPGDSHAYYVPYDAEPRAIPGVWVSRSAGEALRRRLAQGPCRVRLDVDAVRQEVESHNVVGELPGADEERVVIGSHHDGPWRSAVEDASGIALVLAQARYWSQLPAAERPHRLVFVLNAGHMAGGAGQRAFIEAHHDALARTVLELHLEHAACECVERDGAVEPTGRPEVRWWFTSRIPRLETAVREAIEREALGRSMMLAPDALAPVPTTDGGMFHAAGVPLVNFITAPFYLFDEMDTLEKIHRPSLVPVTRAAARIVESTTRVSAAAMRGA